MAEARRLLQPVAAGLAALAIVLAGSAATVDLGAAGWLAGSACGAAVIGSVALGLHRARDHAYASMRDQYVYLGLQRLELAKRDRPPLFAEVDLVSSHEPWTQIPPLIPWNQVGDGSIFYRRPVDTTRLRDTAQAYGRSVEYTMRTLFSFVQHYGRRNLVMIVLGDHQPGHIVSRFGVDHDVPISIIAHDPAVLRRIDGWGWVAGMRPTSGAPTWRMSAFRDRFLTAFGPQPAGTS